MAKRSILVVDDEKGIRRIVSDYLKSEDFNVIEAEDGNTALSFINEQNPCLIIMDIMMPGINGWEACREIKKVKDIPVIIITACEDETTKILSFDAGADDFLTKPFSPKELVGRTKAILRRFDDRLRVIG